MVVFDPRACVDEKCKAGGVAFWKAVRAEAFDLRKTAFGKIVFVAVLAHAAHEEGAEFRDGAVFFEGGEGPTQAVGLFGGETRADNGDLHRLFLKERHAEGFAKDCAKFV